MFNIMLGILVVMFILLVCMLVFLVHLNTWIDTVDEELEMISFNIEDHATRLKSLETLSNDVEKSVHAEVYRQLNMRELEQ